MSPHDNMATERAILWIERGKLLAFIRRDETLEDRTPLVVEIARNLFPIKYLHMFLSRQGGGESSGMYLVCLHVCSSLSKSLRLRSTPQRYPDKEPSFFTMRWQGMATASLFAPQACATARAAFGASIRQAISV